MLPELPEWIGVPAVNELPELTELPKIIIFPADDEVSEQAALNGFRKFAGRRTTITSLSGNVGDGA